MFIGTVKELKEFLDGFPDNTPVTIGAESYTGKRVHRMPLVFCLEKCKAECEHVETPHLVFYS